VFSVRNGVRHLLGAGAGLLATPLIAAGVMYGLSALPGGFAQYQPAGLFGAALVVGVLAGSRVSPIASLLPGLVFAGLWGAVMVRTSMGGDSRLWYEFVPSAYVAGWTSLIHSWSPVVGCILLAASVFPSRWRGKVTVSPPPPPEEKEEAPEPPPLPKRIPSRY
jgi:hypothetical protein